MLVSFYIPHNQPCTQNSNATRKERSRQKTRTVRQRRVGHPTTKTHGQKRDEVESISKGLLERETKNPHVSPIYGVCEGFVLGSDEIQETTFQLDHLLLMFINHSTHHITLPLIPLKLTIISNPQSIPAIVPKNSPQSRAVRANSL